MGVSLAKRANFLTNHATAGTPDAGLALLPTQNGTKRDAKWWSPWIVRL